MIEMDLDPTTHGIIDTFVDYILRDEMLEEFLKTAKYYYKNGVIDSVKSCMFGFIYAGVQAAFYAWIKNLKREPRKDEVLGFISTFEERVPKIKSRILEIASK